MQWNDGWDYGNLPTIHEGNKELPSDVRTIVLWRPCDADNDLWAKNSAMKKMCLLTSRLHFCPNASMAYYFLMKWNIFMLSEIDCVDLICVLWSRFQICHLLCFISSEQGFSFTEPINFNTANFPCTTLKTLLYVTTWNFTSPYFSQSLQDKTVIDDLKASTVFIIAFKAISIFRTLKLFLLTNRQCIT